MKIKKLVMVVGINDADYVTQKMGNNWVCGMENKNEAGLGVPLLPIFGRVC